MIGIDNKVVENVAFSAIVCQTLDNNEDNIVAIVIKIKYAIKKNGCVGKNQLNIIVLNIKPIKKAINNKSNLSVKSDTNIKMMFCADSDRYVILYLKKSYELMFSPAFFAVSLKIVFNTDWKESSSRDFPKCCW